MNSTFNEKLRQVILLALIILLVFVFITQLYIFLPGLLGGITLYILSRTLYFRLIFKKKWKKGWTAFLFILGYVIIIGLPIYFAVQLISPKINELINNPDNIIQKLKLFSSKVKARYDVELFSEQNIRNLTQRISNLIPRLINSTANVVTNLIMMFFLLYYLLVNGSGVEKYLSHIIPLKPKNINKLAHETKLMIRSNALGIPIICMVQGVFAAIGYWIFGLSDWGMWGFITGVFAFFPIVGTMIVWVPLVIAMFVAGQTWMAVGLTIYSAVVTGNVDYITRLGLLKKMGNVHPVITVIGVIIGLNLFGFMGLIFGPLLVSYFLVLVKIYMNEFTEIEENQLNLN